MKKPNANALFRQGDVLFRRIPRLPNSTLTKRESGVVALGEATGHSHSLSFGDRDIATVLEADSSLFVHVDRSDRAGATFVHEEHWPVTLPAGNFEVIIQREYSPEKIRPVQD
jgi:hypothetical protein